MDAPILNGIERTKVEVFGDHLRKMGASAMNVTTVGIDLAKNVLQVQGVDARGTVALRRQLRRDQVTTFFTGTAAHAAAKVRMYGCSLSLQAIDT